MPIGQAIFLAVLGVLFAALCVYLFILRPRKQRRLPPRREERFPEPEEIQAEAPPAEAEPEAREALPPPAVEEEARREAEERAGAEAKRAEAERERRAAPEAKRREVDEEAAFRRREAEERRRRAEADRRDREERAAERRREEAERRRKAEEEARKRREEEERRRAEEEARRKAEEDARRRAEEEENRKKAEDLNRRRERLNRLREGLGKTRDEGFVGRIGTLFGKKALDAELLGDLEEIMLTADIGVKTADSLFNSVKEGLSRNEIQDPAAVFRCLKAEARKILEVGKGSSDSQAAKPYVIMMVGVNGSGKTTTIGKLAAQYKARQKSVLLAAGDTFRAAAAEQLEVWANRVGAAIVRGQEGADPSSVIFNAILEAQAKGLDVVIADTAGRLQTKIPLMDELKKIRRVIGKAAPGAPHEVLLVLDATNGQNAISQAKLFNEALELSGIVLTKLDGTAKGGVILGISNELRIPVRYIGIGESVEDLREFNPDDFLEALFEIRDAAA
jgi:fused signal recognition particle receptor